MVGSGLTRRGLGGVGGGFWTLAGLMSGEGVLETDLVGLRLEDLGLLDLDLDLLQLALRVMRAGEALPVREERGFFPG